MKWFVRSGISWFTILPYWRPDSQEHLIEAISYLDGQREKNPAGLGTFENQSMKISNSNANACQLIGLKRNSTVRN